MIKFIFCIFILSSFIFGQQDTIIYNPQSLNYEVYYTGSIFETQQSYRDTSIYFEFVPGNKIIPHVKSWVNKTTENKYQYYYRIKNDNESIQNLKKFRLQFNNSEQLSTNISTLAWRHLSRKKVFSWWAQRWLEPSWEVEGFILESPYIPTIGLSRFFGTPSDMLRFPGDIYPKSSEMRDKIGSLSANDYNSIQKYTLVPSANPELLTTISIVDTLLSHTRKASELFWINDEATKDKYITNFENTKDHLEQSNNSASRALLEIVLQDVETDSSITLTSEAYALIKYNTEYLLEQITAE